MVSTKLLMAWGINLNDVSLPTIFNSVYQIETFEDDCMDLVYNTLWFKFTPSKDVHDESQLHFTLFSSSVFSQSILLLKNTVSHNLPGENAKYAYEPTSGKIIFTEYDTLKKMTEYYIGFKFAIHPSYVDTELPTGFGLLQVFHNKDINNPILEIGSNMDIIEV